MAMLETFDVVVVGGGPAGATAACDLAGKGYSVLLLDRAGRIKPCGGAIPPRLIADFEIPNELLVAKIKSARMKAPSNRLVDMPIDGGFVGMVDRDTFDEWLRERAARAGAKRRDGTFKTLTRDADGIAIVSYKPRETEHAGHGDGRHALREQDVVQVRARIVIGADGANSAVGRQAVPGAERMPYVFAYHEVVRSPVPPAPDASAAASPAYDSARCDIYYQGRLSPDFYAWVFPHGDTASIGVGSARKGFSLRGAVGELRQTTGLDRTETIRKEGAPIPLAPLKRWDNGRDVLLAGDAAGVVAPASGEGIYYAMLSGRLAAEAVERSLATGDARCLASARKRFMRDHGRVFWVLGMMQYFWYKNDARRERFVTMCQDRDVQRLTWDAYMNKRLVRAEPMAHVRIFFKDMAHLLGLVKA